jgi:para-aminobenzoate synthetase / 4-amino-4-deoxychorismate lyase
LDEHLSRLAQSAAFFCRAVSIEGVRQKLNDSAAGLPSVPHRVRVQVPPSGEATLAWRELPGNRRPYRITLSTIPIDSKDRLLYHKTNDRSAYDRALAAAPGQDDVLLWNENGELTESTIANLVVEKDGLLITPPLSCGVLPGVYRSYLLKHNRITEGVVRVQELESCSRIFLINSVRGIWEVRLGPAGKKPRRK